MTILKRGHGRLSIKGWELAGEGIGVTDWDREAYGGWGEVGGSEMRKGCVLGERW